MMFHMKSRLVLKPDLRVFQTKAVHHSLVLLLLLYTWGGHSQVVGTSKPVVGLIGQDVTLPCNTESAEDAHDMTLEWARPDLDPRFVLLRRGGLELLNDKNSMYSGRSSLSINKLKCGDVSLKLSKVKLSDAGTYKCNVPKTGTKSDIKLTVGSVSIPAVTITTFSGGVQLDCSSKGWYPEPEVLWVDGEGKNVSAAKTETTRGPDDLYTVSSTLTVEKKLSNSFTCRVQQKNINQIRETEIHVPAELFMVQSSPAVRISINVAVCLMSVAAVVLVVWKWGPNKKTMKHPEAVREPGERNTLFGNSGELQLLMENEGGREQPGRGHEKIIFLDMRKAKLEEELEKNEGDLRYVLEVIETLEEQKEDLKKHREKLISLQRDDTVQISQIEKELISTSFFPKETRERLVKGLKERRSEHDKEFGKTEKLLETTDTMIVKMTEWKGRLENDKEKITKNLNKIKKLLEEIQRELKQQERERVQMKPQPEQPEREESQIKLQTEQAEREEGQIKLQTEQTEREEGQIKPQPEQPGEEEKNHSTTDKEQ